MQDNITVVGLDGRPNNFNDFFHLVTHVPSLETVGPQTTVRRSGWDRNRGILWNTDPMSFLSGWSLALLMAHQGGWDEALFVLIPIGVMVALLWFATRKAKKIGAARREAAAQNQKQPD